MKCIYCQNDSKYSDRIGGKCPGCGKAFAFEPKNQDPLTDAAFKAAIDRVSSNEQVKWGVEHLRYEVWRLLSAKARKTRRAGWMVVGAGALLLTCAVTPLFVFAIIGGIAILVGILVISLSRRPSLEQSEFDRLYDRYTAAHGVPKTAIVRRPRQGPEPTRIAPDLLEYSFDRAVICDRARTVDLLVANQFHFENNCAILGAEGYPKHAFEIVRSMLKKNPKLEVFVLHDATVEGCALAKRLSTDPKWFGGQNLRIVDVGLRPAHAKFYPGMEVPADPAPQGVPEGGTHPEMAWLRKNKLELAVVRPDQIVKRLYRAMTNLPEPADGDNGGVSGSDVWIYGGDYGTSDGGADSFG